MRPFALPTPYGLLAAHVHRPDDDLVTPQPAVVVTGSWLTVKEQMPDRYAAALAARGFTAVTFDFSGFGQSPGAPRQAELPMQKAGEIAAAVRAVTSLSFVHPQVGVLAVCASAQYALRAIADGAPIAALACVAGWFHDAVTVAPLYGGPDGVADRLARAERALAAYQADGTVLTVPAYAEGDDRAGMSLPLPYYGQADRGAVPEWRNEMAELSWAAWLTFDGMRVAEQVAAPTLLVHADDCVLPDNVRALADWMPAAEVAWGEGSQIDFYDQRAQVDFAVAAAEAHFGRHLEVPA